MSAERVVGLIALRYLAYAFDLSVDGPLADPEAKRLVVSARPSLGGTDVHHAPLLVFTAAGELLLELESEASEDEVFENLQRLLGQHPEFDTPSAEEREWQRRSQAGDRSAARALALNAMARGRYDEAVPKLVELVELLSGGPERDSLAYWLGRAHRLRGDPAAMEAAFDRISEPAALAEELLLERAQQLLVEGRHADLRRILAHHDLVELSAGSVPPRGPRATEALYLLGLAHFELDDTERAQALWRALVQRYPEDGWVRRADWAVFRLTTREGGSPSAARSLLGRAYSGRAHPDLGR